MGHNLFLLTLKKFTKQLGIKRILCPPNHPASNGEVEWVVRTFKASYEKSLKASVASQPAIFWFSYRTTIHLKTGVTPAELFLKRRLRTPFELCKPILSTAVAKKRRKECGSKQDIPGG